MPENYARENTNRANAKNNGSNSKACNKAGMNEASNRSPLSKQNAAQRKTQDCDR
ncbi:MAG: hypothetical protein IKL57_07250 [Oscillospiraceae bacterium]|nr:hypothetical protein [Oscillospiraceae bacterium]